MPLDPSIALQYRPIQLDNQLESYSRMMQIQNAGNLNRLAEIQYRQAMRAEADQNTLRSSLAGVDISTPEGMAQARNALIRMGNIKGAQELDKNALATTKTKGEISKQDADLAYQRLGILGGALAPLAQNPTRQAVTQTLQSLRAQGIPQPPIPLPADDAQLPAWVQQVAALTDKGLKALEAFAPKVDMTNLGATTQPMNTNALAGPVGPLAGAQPIARSATPGEMLANQRGIEANALGKQRVAATWADVDTKKEANRVALEVAGAKRTQDVELKLQDDYRAEAKGFSETATAMKKVLGALDTADKNPGSALAAGTAFMKILDPNSVVRESELGMALNASGWFDRATNIVATLQAGKIMTKTQTKNLRAAAETLFDEAKSAQREIDASFEGRAKAYGANPKNIIVDRGQKATSKGGGIDPTKLSDAELMRELNKPQGKR